MGADEVGRGGDDGGPCPPKVGVGGGIGIGEQAAVKGEGAVFMHDAGGAAEAELLAMVTWVRLAMFPRERNPVPKAPELKAMVELEMEVLAVEPFA